MTDTGHLTSRNTDFAANRFVPDLLAECREIPVGELGAKAVSDPTGSVRVDVDLIRHEVPGGRSFLVSGLVYDVDTGLVDTVVAPIPLGAG
jgi:carbonic anhydrase